MKYSLASVIVCPECKSQLDLRIKKRTKNRVHKGELFCKKCRKSFEIINDIVCFRKLGLKDKNEKKIQNTKELFLGQEYKKEWYKHFSKKEFSILKQEWKFIINNLDLKESKIHLDWATGTARFLRNILGKARGEVIALDFGYPNCLALRLFLKKLNKYSKVTIICGDARNMPFSSNSIDSVSSWHGLDEPNINEAIDESKRILKKNKKIAVSGLFYEKGSKSLKIAKKSGIKLAEKDKAYTYFKKLKFKNIKYKKFPKVKETSHKNFIPKYGDYYTIYGISGKK